MCIRDRTYTFTKAMGGKIGISICEDDKLDLALDLMKKAKEKGVNLISVSYTHLSVRRFASPINGIDRIRTFITVVYPLFITHHFFTCIDKRNSL